MHHQLILPQLVSIAALTDSSSSCFYTGSRHKRASKKHPLFSKNVLHICTESASLYFMQMVSHKPRHRANCIDLLHSYLVNLALQFIKPPPPAPAAAVPAPAQAKQPVEAGLPLSSVWLATTAVSVVQQVSFHDQTQSLSSDQSTPTS